MKKEEYYEKNGGESMRLRRSLAWTHGDDFERTRRQIDSECDGITIDLEDAIMPSKKPAARAGALEMLTKWDFKGKERIVRINSPQTEFYKVDIEEVVKPGLPDAVRLPKCENVEDVLQVDKDLYAIEKEAGLPENTIEIIALIESPLGILRSFEIACCCKRVTALSIGMEDLTAEMEIPRRYEIGATELLYARQYMVLAAKAAGIQAIDSGFNKLCPVEFNRPYNEESRRMGFDGRSVRDGEQARIANEIYGPSLEEIDWAIRAAHEYNKGNQNGDNEVYVDGKHLCAAAYLKAVKTLEKKHLIEEKEKNRKL